MFDYFDIELINDEKFIDVFKNIDFTEILKSEDYTYHTIESNENIMDISYRYYNNINDWWVIYVFNDIYDINFFYPNDDTIQETIDYFINNFIDYDNLSEKKKNEVKHELIKYYNTIYDYKTSIIMANDRLSTIENRTNAEFLNSGRVYIEDFLINDSFHVDKLKIPNLSLTFKIKNYLEELSIDWKNK